MFPIATLSPHPHPGLNYSSVPSLVHFETKVMIIHTLIFSITMYRCKRWRVKKTDGKNIDLFKAQYWRRALQVPRNTGIVNKWVLEQIKFETSWGKNDKTEAALLGHIMRRQGFLEKTIMLENIKVSR